MITGIRTAFTGLGEKFGRMSMSSYLLGLISMLTTG